MKKKTPLEHFQDIKELEVADEQGKTVADILPYKCEQVEKSLKALEIIKEKIIWVEDGKLMCGRYADIEIELEEDFESKDELDLLKEVLEC